MHLLIRELYVKDKKMDYRGVPSVPFKGPPEKDHPMTSMFYSKLYFTKDFDNWEEYIKDMTFG